MTFYRVKLQHPETKKKNLFNSRRKLNFKYNQKVLKMSHQN